MQLIFFSPIGGLYADKTKEQAENFKDLNSISKFSEFTPTICENTSTGVSKVLLDERANSTYTVVKLADGRCWTAENLRYVSEKPAEDEEFYDSKQNDIGLYYNYYASLKSCPANFSLPSKDDYENLKDVDFLEFKPVYSGYFDFKSTKTIGESAFFWSTTGIIELTKSHEIKSEEFSKQIGASVRCISSKTDVDQTNETEADPEEKSAETTEKSNQAKDQVKETEESTTEPTKQSESPTQESLDNNQTTQEHSSSQDTSSQI